MGKNQRDAEAFISSGENNIKKAVGESETMQVQTQWQCFQKLLS